MTEPKKPKPKKLRAPEDVPAAPRGLGGVCWARHPEILVHCTDSVGHTNPAHYHAYSGTTWRD